MVIKDGDNRTERGLRGLFIDFIIGGEVLRVEEVVEEEGK
jgi:hypothetical protein